MNIMKYKTSNLSLLFIGAATIIGNLFGTFTSAYPTWLKLLYGICIYASLVYFPYNKIQPRFQTFGKYTKAILWLILILSIFEIIKGIFVENILSGNQYMTLFFNPTFAPIFYNVLFLFYGEKKNITFLKKIVYINIIAIVIGLCFHSIDLRIVLIACSLYPIMNNKYKIAVFILIVICLYVNFINQDLLGGGKRKLLIIIGVSFAAYICVYVLKKQFFIKILALLLCLSPLVTLYNSIFQTEDSFFVKAGEYISGNSTQTAISINDTRTFLYKELAEDLSHNNSWLLGKSAYSSYYSAYFEINGSDSKNRAGSEVTILNYILRGGIIYAILWTLLLFISIKNAIYKSQNKWLKFVGINLAGFYFNSFMGDFSGFDLTTTSIWILAGLSLNNQWLNIKDQQIKILY